jgi:hypothetical protein
MGRNTTTPDPQQLSRFSVGEIQDFSGVPDFYNAGTSKWLRSATPTDSSNLSSAAKTNLASAGTADAQTVLAQSSLSFSTNSSGYVVSMPIQRISGSNVSVVPAYYLGSTAVGVGVITSAGVQTVATGQVSQTTSTGQSGTNGVVASNDTTIFSYTNNAATTVTARSTTNGTTWTAETVTGLPTFDFSTNTRAFASTSQVPGGAYGTVAAPYGWNRNKTFDPVLQNFDNLAVFWCGARFLLVGHGSTNYVVSLSTNGYDFGGDNTAAVLGTQAKTQNMQFYRNGNNCYLNVGTAYRYSTDGGVTWAACTFAASPNPQSYYMQYNQSDPAKLVIRGSRGTDTSAYYSADSGQTWSANRALPTVAPNDRDGGLYYRGSTLVTSNASNATHVSTDDGATWTASTFPIGVLSTNTKVFADANRWYLGISDQKQLLTSSDGVSWTIRNLPQNFTLNEYSSGQGIGYGIVPFDSDVVVLLGATSSSNQALFTLDGGVTWTGSRYTVGATKTGWGVGNAFVSPDGGGFGFAAGTDGLTSASNTNVRKADIVAGGAFYQTGTTAITPLRTNALAFVRVE